MSRPVDEQEKGVVKIIWTRHAEERQKEWEKKLGITRQRIEDLLCSPKQIVIGYRGASVAQSRWAGGLLRVPFVELEERRKILTIYWTSKVDKCWEVKKDAD